MTFSFLNLAILFGLIAVVIPPLIHLLNRRRYDVVDWGAMQFLEISEITRRRLLIEELLLMLLRMGLIAILVMAIAGPFLKGVTWMPQVGRGNRDVVLILDGSASMTYEGEDETIHERAKKWTEKFLDQLHPGDSVALLQAREQVVGIVPALTSNIELVREKLKDLPAPGGSTDWAKAVQTAQQILKESKRAQREIIVIGDGQRYGWSDQNTMLRWEDLANQNDPTEKLRPGLYAVNLDPKRPEEQPNWTLAPIKATRAVVARNQQVRFSTAILLNGSQKYSEPYEIRLEVDGKEIKKIQAPKAADLKSRQVPFQFEYRFTKTGSHLVSVILEPDLPKHLRDAGYEAKDHLALDNRQDFAVEVVRSLPVLLVDGDNSPDPPRRGSDFLKDALAPRRDTSPVVQVKVVSAENFQSRDLTESLPPDPRLKDQDKAGEEAVPLENRPRVLILHNVKMLKPEQREAMEAFLKEGGGVLVCLGQRVDARHYNDKLFRDGKGWLPAQLDQIVGDEKDVQKAARPVPSSFFHPALEMFRTMRFGGLDRAWTTRWWHVTVPRQKTPATPIAMLNKISTPFLVERPYEEGKVLLSVVPLDQSWRTNLTTLPAFVPLTHELVYYLAGARSARYNLQPGQPLRYRLPSEADAAGLELTSPTGETRPLKADEPLQDEHYVAEIVRKPQHSTLIHEGMRESGIWKLTTPDDRTVYYVVQPDRQEANLAPTTEEDRESVKKLVPFHYENDADQLVAKMKESDELELWWWFLLGIIALLCAEVWMTRRIVKKRAL